MTPIRVMHFADTHFGVENYGRLDPATGLHTRLMDFKRSLLTAIDMALDAGIDLAVFAGDAYKTRDPRQTDQREFADCIRRLTSAGVPVVMLTGNHDMPSVRGRANAVEIYHTLGVTNVSVLSKPELLLVETARGPVRIAAMPYLIRGLNVPREEFQGKSLEETRELLEAKYAETIGTLADRVTAAADMVPTILLGHFWARGARLSSWQQGYFNVNEPQVPRDALTNRAFDYVALGHIHRHQDLNPDAQPHVVYCGSPDRIDFGEKDEPKGFVMLEVQKGGADYHYVPNPETRPLIDIDVDADCDEPTERILEAIAHQPVRSAIVKLTYRIGHARQALVREREIREALAPAFYQAAFTRRVIRDASARSRLLTESVTPREALGIFIDATDRLKPRKEILMKYAEPMLQQLETQER